MNLPNKLTVFRCVLVPFILLFMLPLPYVSIENAWNQFILNHGMVIALVLFVIAAITDYLDGYLARKNNLVTNLGVFLDPIADKILVLCPLIVFVQFNEVHPGVPLLLVIREFSVTGLRLISVEQKLVISANSMGKIKTVFQIVMVILLMVDIIFRNYNLPLSHAITVISLIFVPITVVLTLVSGLQYFKAYADIFKKSK